MEAKELFFFWKSSFSSFSIQGLYQSHTIYAWYIYLHLPERQTIHVAKFTITTSIHASWFFTFSIFLGFFLQDPLLRFPASKKSLCQVASDSALQGKKLQRSSASSSNEPSLPLATSQGRQRKVMVKYLIWMQIPTTDVYMILYDIYVWCTYHEPPNTMKSKGFGHLKNQIIYHENL